ncbi:hypothetical protein AJ79_06366 [Helicocarpus griseus UAMH5409]|uniref:Uncharacterized protein n=1 Tax=Helicocarpus griseus UAMH5409 TaxID=1447875 RepID=A0A2B7XEK4_9EURO|nr:hypothetical protein AJ79_06366 [Helicocarpus griseus UAMH5409]
MDPLSIVSGAAGLTGLTFEVARITTLYIREVKSAPQEIIDLSIETTALSDVLQRLEAFLQTEVKDSILFEPKSGLALVLEHCRVQLDTLCKKVNGLNCPDKGRLATPWGKLKWPLDRKECLETARRLHECTQTFHFCLSLNHIQQMSESSKTLQSSLVQQKNRLEEVTTLLLEVPEELSNLAQEISAVLIAVTDATVLYVILLAVLLDLLDSGRIQDEIFQWLSPLESSKRHRDIRSGRVEDTWKWVLESTEFLNWSGGNPSHPSLYFYGDPGAGKTYLMSVVIDELLGIRQRSGRNNIGISFVYCDCQNKSGHSIANIIGEILKQLLAALPIIPGDIMDIYNARYRKEKTSPELSDTVSLLRLTCGYLDRAYICIGALDECTDPVKLLSLLSEFPPIQICVSSRKHLKETVRKHIIDILSVNVVAKESDIKQFVTSKIEGDRTQDPELMDDSLRIEMTNKITALSAGLFLLPAFHVRLVLEARTKSKRRAALASLTSGLDEAFSSTMERIKLQPDASTAQARKILMWIYLARRSLHVDELMHALATDIGDRDLDKDNLPSKTSFLDCCLGLVVLEEGTSRVRLVHHSLGEYIGSIGGENFFPGGHETIAQACLTYLLFESTTNKKAKLVPSTDKTKREWKSKFALYRYAASNWGYHARKSPCLSEQTTKLVKRYLSLDSETIALSIAHIAMPNIGRLEDPTSFSPLHLISFFGLAHFVDEKYATPTTINKKDSAGRTPLLLATIKRHPEATRLLLERGANPNIASMYGETPLLCAAENGYGKIVSHLLAHRPKLGSNKGFFSQQTPLAAAAKNGHREVVKLLLDAGADVDPNDVSSAKLLLCFAVNGGYEGILKRLLNKGPGCVVKDVGFLVTLLRTSITKGHIGIPKLLLEQGIEFEPRDTDGAALLSLAAQNSHEDIVQLLVKHGAGRSLRKS